MAFVFEPEPLEQAMHLGSSASRDARRMKPHGHIGAKSEAAQRSPALGEERREGVRCCSRP
jgi:hypothetical protein